MIGKTVQTRVLVGLVCLTFVAGLTGCGNTGSKDSRYPERPINVIVPFAVGGLCDRSNRAIHPIAAEFLKQTIVVNNVTGGAGSVGWEAVLSKPADGYTLLAGSEDITLHGVMDISKLTYDAVEPIACFATTNILLVVPANAPWKDIGEFVADVKSRPGVVKLGTSGAAGQQAIGGAILNSALGLKIVQVPYDGGGPAITATLGGHVDFYIGAPSSVGEYIKAGKMRALASFTNEKIKGMDGVPALGELYPETKKYLPFGTMYSVCVKKGTPQPVKDKLTEAYKKAMVDPRYLKFCEENDVIPLNLTGADALAYIKKWQSSIAWAMHNAGATKKSPAEFNIPKP